MCGSTWGLAYAADMQGVDRRQQGYQQQQAVTHIGRASDSRRLIVSKMRSMEPGKRVMWEGRRAWRKHMAG